MAHAIGLKKLLTRGGLLFLFASLLGLFFASQSYLAYQYRGYEADFVASMSVTMPDWYVWALLTPLIFGFARRYSLQREKGIQRFCFLFVFGVAVTFAKIWVVATLTGAIGWLPDRGIQIVQFHANFLTYCVLVGLSHIFAYNRKFQERELRASQLESQLAQAQLQVLKMQLQPHFLFNTLHAITTLMRKDVEAADRMMARLSDLLRLTLDNAGVQEVSLKQELDFLQGYLEIEQMRFQDRLTVRTRIEPQVLEASVPNLILQPLVENAIRHGIEPYNREGLVEIMAARTDGRLVLKIRDNGPGHTAGDKNRINEGIGLANTRSRLQQLYGSEFKFEFGNAEESGFEINLEIPFKSTSNATAVG